MKIFELSILLLGMAFFQVACSKSKASAPLTPDVGTPMGLSLSKNQGMDGTKAHLQPTIIYTTLSAPVSPAFSTSLSFFQKLPEDFDDNIESFTLDKGFMATFAENVDGTGESICYVAAVSNITENLPERIKNKASFVRFIPINNVPKKGTCNTNINAVNALQSAWFYNWGLSQTTTATLQYVPMTWGKNAASLEQASNFIGRFGLDHILSFNEPDNSNQSNIASIDTAINRYKLLLFTGLRMGSPATEQDNIWDTKWQSQFISAAYVQKMRVDFLAVHWYDWGNQTVAAATDDLTAEGVFNRFKNYVNKVRTIYPNIPLWVTEYNANPARSEAVQIKFMRLSSEWLNTQTDVERYAYFFPAAMQPVTTDFKLTAMGQAWVNLPSPSSFTTNIIPR